MKRKEAVFFSMDALIALAILIMGTLFIYPLTVTPNYDSQIHIDVLESLSAIKIGDLNSSYSASLIATGNITDLNKSVLEQLGEFYVLDKEVARQLASSVFSEVNSTQNFGLWIGDELIYSSNFTPYDDSRNVLTERQVISGIQEGDSVTAFSGRAYLARSLKNKYFYFGGYVGEGNLSALVEYSGEIKSAKMELAITEDFEVFVNGILAGNFSGSSSPFIPVEYNLSIDNFNNGTNIVEFRGDNLNIDGGFIKISYDEEAEFGGYNRQYLPGIEGLINLFDGFKIPGQLNALDIFLNLTTNITIFFNIGNTTIYNSSTGGENAIVIFRDTDLASLLDYDELSERTVPIRIGIENASYVTNFSRPADVFSVTDLSGSMTPEPAHCDGFNWCCFTSPDWCESQETCEGCGRAWIPYEDKIGEAIAANNVFIDAILNNSGNRVGLNGYESEYPTRHLHYYHELSNDSTSLHAEVNSWGPQGSTCICRGISIAVDGLVANSSSEQFRSIVVMSDGMATQACDTSDPRQDAIDAACDAYNNHGIYVYAIGFGSDADEATLQSIAACGNGSYYYGNVSSLTEIYETIANELIEASFFEQELSVLGEVDTILYPDSFIQFDYDEPELPHGLITTTEKKFDDEYSGTFELPENSTIVEVYVASYSGSRWTDEVIVNGNVSYDLSSYGSEYLDLGDPYSVSVPNDYVGQANIVNLTTGLSPLNSSEGSEYNKIIYTIVHGSNAAYSSLSSASEGCNWEIQFEDDNFLSAPIPQDYSGGEDCYYEVSKVGVSNENDARQTSVLNLLRLLDYDDDGRVDVEFGEDDLEITSSEVIGIPYDWSTEVQVRTWS